MKNKLILFLLLLLPMVILAQPGFIKTMSERLYFKGMVVDNDTIVLYSIVWDKTGAQGVQVFKFDSLGNKVAQSEMFIDSLGVFAGGVLQRELIKTTDGGYAFPLDFIKYKDNPFDFGVPVTFNLDHDLNLIFQKKELDVNRSLVNSILEMPDGGFLILVWISEEGWDGHSEVIRLDKNGQRLWRKNYDDPGVTNGCVKIKKINDNAYMIFGTKSEIIFPDKPTWVYAHLYTIDSLGNKLWEWDAKSEDNIFGIFDCDFLPNGDKVCIAGAWEELPNSPGSYSVRPQIIGLDADYQLKWQHIYSNVFGIAPQQFRQMVKTPDGNYVASGHMMPPFPYGGLPATSMRAVHFKFTPQGDSLWMRLDSVDGVTNPPFETVFVFGTGLLSSGSIISCGHFQNKNFIEYGILIKLSPNGCIDTLNCWPVATDPEILASRQALSVYPNPATNYVILSNNGAFFDKESEIQVIDGLGRMIARYFPEGDEIQIDVKKWPSGVYFYRYLVDGLELGIGRIVVEE